MQEIDLLGNKLNSLWQSPNDKVTPLSVTADVPILYFSDLPEIGSNITQYITHYGHLHSADFQSALFLL